MSTRSSDDSIKSRKKSYFQFSNILTRKIIREHLGFLSTSVNNKHVFVELDLSGLQLSNIDALAGYVHLQVLKMAHNSVSSLNVLSSLRSLVYLDVPYNQNHRMFDFDPPTYLREANYNHNVITMIPGALNGLSNLTKLQLDHNKIRRIGTGLLFCKQLNYLSMCGNEIRFIDNLKNLPLRVLLLASNYIPEITNLETLVHLEVLDLSRNTIQSLTGLKAHYYLNDINLSGNQIKNLQECTVFGKLPALRTLEMIDNPVYNNTLYKSTILAQQPSILTLDGHRLTVDEKVNAIYKILPQKDIVSVTDRFVNSVYNFQQPLKISACTPDEKAFKFPMLVLLGPLGSFKTRMINRLVADFPDFWRNAKSHSTRKTPPGGNIYNCVTLAEFQRLQEEGKFIQTARLYGEHFGLAWETINEIAREGFYPIVDMELEAILSMRWTNFHLYLIVAMPHDIEIQRTRLATTLGLSEEIVQEAMGRRDVYADYYNTDSGLFNMYVNTDNLEEAYIQLKEMVANVKSQIIADKIEKRSSFFQWKPSADIDTNNNTEIDAFEYRRQRTLAPFMDSRAGRQFPHESRFVVILSDEVRDDVMDDSSYSTKSELSLINVF